MVFFFFKQKTAYEMRISDWSSDVCSSDLKRLSENVGVSDTVQAIRELLQGLNESLSLSDNRSVNAGRRIDENAGLSDAKTFASLKSVSEKIGRASCRERVCQYV